MENNIIDDQFVKEVEVIKEQRQYLRLSDIDNDLMNDLNAMFGHWKEADHCD